jgi:hypothetical protein
VVLVSPVGVFRRLEFDVRVVDLIPRLAAECGSRLLKMLQYSCLLSAPANIWATVVAKLPDLLRRPGLGRLALAPAAPASALSRPATAFAFAFAFAFACSTQSVID